MLIHSFGLSIHNSYYLVRALILSWPKGAKYWKFQMLEDTSIFQVPTWKFWRKLSKFLKGISWFCTTDKNESSSCSAFSPILGFSFFFFNVILANLVSENHYLIVVLIFIFLMTNSVYHTFSTYWPLFKKILLEYRWLKMLYCFQVYSKVH